MLERIFINSELQDILSDICVVPSKLASLDPLKDKGVVIFGAGLHGQHALERLLGSGIRPDWIIDNNPSFHGRTFDNIVVRPADSLREIKDRYILLTSGHTKSMRADCHKYGATNYLMPASLPLYFITGSAMGENLEDLEKNSSILDLYNILADSTSRKHFKNLIAYQLTMNNKYFGGCGPEDMYFPDNVQIDYSHFVDVGAFDGDTLKMWLKKFDYTNAKSFSYHAFEPGPQFSQLQAYMASLPSELRTNLHAHRMAIGNSFGEINLGAELCINALDEKPEEQADTFSVPLTTLDAALTGVAPTLIKADVEGFEMDLLNGAMGTIKAHRPSLAISVYHKRGDMWQIPLWIHNLNLNYKIYLRNHRPTYSDSVCYAVCPK